MVREVSVTLISGSRVPGDCHTAGVMESRKLLEIKCKLPTKFLLALRCLPLASTCAGARMRWEQSDPRWCGFAKDSLILMSFPGLS